MLKNKETLKSKKKTELLKIIFFNKLSKIIAVFSVLVAIFVLINERMDLPSIKIFLFLLISSGYLFLDPLRKKDTMWSKTLYFLNIVIMSISVIVAIYMLIVGSYGLISVTDTSELILFIFSIIVLMAIILYIIQLCYFKKVILFNQFLIIITEIVLFGVILSILSI